jgi:hypothetical protein
MHGRASSLPTTLSVQTQVAQGLFPRHPMLFTYMILQVEDSPTTDLVRYFPKCFDFIDTAISKGGKHRGLVHGGGGGLMCWRGARGTVNKCCTTTAVGLKFRGMEFISSRHWALGLHLRQLPICCMLSQAPCWCTHSRGNMQCHYVVRLC